MTAKQKLHLQKRIDSEYLIDIQGRVHSYLWDMAELDTLPVSLHYEILSRLFPDIEYPGDYVYDLGWVFVGGATYTRMKHEPNQAQINTLTDLGIRWK